MDAEIKAKLEEMAREIPLPEFSGYLITKTGEVWSVRRKIPVKKVTRLDKNGYVRVGLNPKGKPNTKTVPVHRLVLITYKPNPDFKKLQVDHINGDKTDNRLENLRWCDHAANMKYLVDSGRSSRGKDHPKTKLTEQQVLWIRENCRPRHHELGFDAVAKKFGVTQSTVRRAFSGVNWKHFKDECSNCQAAWQMATELAVKAERERINPHLEAVRRMIQEAYIKNWSEETLRALVYTCVDKLSAILNPPKDEA